MSRELTAAHFNIQRMYCSTFIIAKKFTAKHSNVWKTEKTMEDEMEVSMNGPVLGEADSLLETSMRQYWKGKGGTSPKSLI
jgi:hypothetical protein